jgi:hypothetical protein
MITLGLLLTAQLVPQSLLDSADAANLAYAQCLFAVSRESSEARLSVGQFERELEGSCLAEARRLRLLSTKILALRGDANAAVSAEQLDREARQGMIHNYQRTLELGPQLERLAEICKVQPDACRQ